MEQSSLSENIRPFKFCICFRFSLIRMSPTVFAPHVTMLTKIWSKVFVLVLANASVIFNTQSHSLLHSSLKLLFFLSIYLYDWRLFYNVFLISFARSNTAQLLADLAFSPHFLTCKMQFFPVNWALFFPFLQALWLPLFKLLESGVLFHELFLLPEMQAQSTFLYLWLQESPLQ